MSILKVSFSDSVAPAFEGSNSISARIQLSDIHLTSFGSSTFTYSFPIERQNKAFEPLLRYAFMTLGRSKAMIKKKNIMMYAQDIAEFERLDCRDQEGTGYKLNVDRFFDLVKYKNGKIGVVEEDKESE